MAVARTHRPSLAPIRIFAPLLLGLALATGLASRLVPALAERTPHISLAERPEGDDDYLAHDRGGHVDHHVHYFGLDRDAIDALSRADVLFLGNSRLMFALRPAVLDPYFRARGLRYYAMGFGFREGDRFPLEVLRRFDVWPPVVVVNADGFFGTGLSEWAANVVEDSRFDAMKRWWESEVTHEVRRAVHRVAPNWLDVFGRPGLPDGDEFIAYRSRRNGTWRVSPWPGRARRYRGWRRISRPDPGRSTRRVPSSRSSRGGAAAWS